MKISFYAPYAEQNAKNQEMQRNEYLEIETIFYVRRT